MLEPKCIDNYCFENNVCEASCSANADMICDDSSSKNLYIPSNGVCCNTAMSSCASATDRYSAVPPAYTVKSVIPATISAVGYGCEEIDTSTTIIDVSPGSVIGFVAANGQATIGYRAIAGSEVPAKVHNAGVSTMSEGAEVTLTADASSKTFMVRAVAAIPTAQRFPLTLDVPGEYEFLLNISNIDSFQLADATVISVIGINESVINAPEYVVTREPFGLSVDPHTGTVLKPILVLFNNI